MPAWNAEALIAHPPVEQWTMLTLPWEGFVERIDGLNMPNLRVLYCDNNSMLATLPWNDLKNLVTLGAYSCGLKTLELWRMPNLSGCYASENYSLTQVDAHGNSSLTNLDVYFCGALASINIRGCINLKYLYAYACSLPQTAVDQILTDLVVNGTTSGYVDLIGGNNAPPSSPDGIALKNVLISRGWTITTN